MTPSDRDWQRLRAHIWLARVQTLFGEARPKVLESQVRKRLGMDTELSNNLSRYLAPDGPLPFRYSKDPRSPRLQDVTWPERLEQLEPGALPWLLTPFWHLWEHDVERDALRECVQLLPETLQEDLLVVTDTPEGQFWELKPIVEVLVYELTRNVGPWSLGALACAMARAKLSGEMGEEKRCVNATIWMLTQMHDQADPRLKPLLECLLHWVLLKASDRVYAAEMRLAVSTSALERFSTGRQREVIDWTLDRALEELSRAD